MDSRNTSTPCWAISFGFLAFISTIVCTVIAIDKLKQRDEKLGLLLVIIGAACLGAWLGVYRHCYADAYRREDDLTGIVAAPPQPPQPTPTLASQRRPVTITVHRPATTLNVSM